MADVNFNRLHSERAGDLLASDGNGKKTGPDADHSSPPYDLIELLFFAYRDFTSDPDDVLAQFDFGRAHHRVLHFVDRNPGIMVTDLLSVLRITKQSLGRVLKQLVDEDFIEQKPGENDRRQRRLKTTEKGHSLAMRLASLQAGRLNQAMKNMSEDEKAVTRKFLFHMINPDSRVEVAKLLRSDDPALKADPDGTQLFNDQETR
ncbi:transcriptional regulator, MarR family [Roseibium hamelinense]|uniref:Transcriptional regulator, MarR family n=1 Tax=Roseibium hamelinense TaxID=150831 RepID=A0A562SXT0_9HYPH|nr:MarR family transcriptional regulator [Roseibium hamelinense]MTI43641.1 MarR family transcriptional regulator [Roseibium hamelinense]TWI86159.1 transcriptional regulator, MarR family [Roseibium hamelinense]